MKLSRLFTLGLGAALASGVALADDLVNLGVLPGSSVAIGLNAINFGQDPPTSVLNNAFITDNGPGAGTLTVSQNDMSFAPSVGADFGGIDFNFQLRAQSDLIGTYDRGTGSSTATGDFDIKITSKAPGFNNDTCIIPATKINFSTDNLGGAAFDGGIGTVVDNTFIAKAIPVGVCGSYIGDWAGRINFYLGLPSLTPGKNRITVVFRMNPTLPPGRIITSIAGNGAAGFSGDGGPATAASLNHATGVAVDASGNLFIADNFNSRVRRVDAVTGIITTAAGNGVEAFSGDGGLAIDAALNGPYGVGLDDSGNLFIADSGNHRVRRVDALTGIITTVAGNGVGGFSGDGGPATGASLNHPGGVAVDVAGNLFIAD